MARIDSSRAAPRWPELTRPCRPLLPFPHASQAEQVVTLRLTLSQTSLWSSSRRLRSPILINLNPFLETLDDECGPRVRLLCRVGSGAKEPVRNSITSPSPMKSSALLIHHSDGQPTRRPQQRAIDLQTAGARLVRDLHMPKFHPICCTRDCPRSFDLLSPIMADSTLAVVNLDRRSGAAHLCAPAQRLLTASQTLAPDS
jgi:hypothetical protein